MHRIQLLPVVDHPVPAVASDARPLNRLSVRKLINYLAVQCGGKGAQIGQLLRCHRIIHFCEIYAKLRIGRHLFRWGLILRRSCLTVAEVGQIYVHAAPDACHRSLAGILPHRMGSAVGGGRCLRIGLLRILRHPYPVSAPQCIHVPLRASFHFISGSVKHGSIACRRNRIQKRAGDVRPLFDSQAVLPAVRRLEIFTVISDRIGDLISGDKIRHPGGFLLRLFLRHRRRKEISAHKNPVLRSLLQIITGSRIFINDSRHLGPVTHADHGELHTGLRHLFPVDGALILGHVDAKRHLVGFSLRLRRSVQIHGCPAARSGSIGSSLRILLIVHASYLGRHGGLHRAFLLRFCLLRRFGLFCFLPAFGFRSRFLRRRF